MAMTHTLRNRKAVRPRLTWYEEFPGTSESAAAARHRLRQLLPPGRLLDDALAVWGELVINAITHTRSGQGGVFGMEAEWLPSRVRLLVLDQGSRGYPVVQDFDPDSESGNGLTIVRGLSLGWGVFGGDRGRAVWADMEWDGTLPDVPHRAGWTPAEPALARLQADFGGTRAWYEDEEERAEPRWWASWPVHGHPAAEIVYAPSLLSLGAVLRAWYPRYHPLTELEQVACGPGAGAGTRAGAAPAGASRST